MAERVDRQPKLKIIEGRKGISSVSELPVRRALQDFETLAKHILTLKEANTAYAIDDIAHMYDHRLAKYPAPARAAIHKLIHPDDTDDDPDPAA